MLGKWPASRWEFPSQLQHLSSQLSYNAHSHKFTSTCPESQNSAKIVNWHCKPHHPLRVASWTLPLANSCFWITSDAFSGLMIVIPTKEEQHAWKEPGGIERNPITILLSLRKDVQKWCHQCLMRTPCYWIDNPPHFQRMSNFMAFRAREIMADSYTGNIWPVCVSRVQCRSVWMN